MKLIFQVTKIMNVYPASKSTTSLINFSYGAFYLIYIVYSVHIQPLRSSLRFSFHSKCMKLWLFLLLFQGLFIEGVWASTNFSDSSYVAEFLSTILFAENMQLFKTVYGFGGWKKHHSNENISLTRELESYLLFLCNLIVQKLNEELKFVHDPFLP